jgi:hypothetical protein
LCPLRANRLVAEPEESLQVSQVSLAYAFVKIAYKSVGAVETIEAERMAQVPDEGPAAIRQVTTCVFGALGGLLLGYDLGVVAGALLLISKHFSSARSNRAL